MSYASQDPNEWQDAGTVLASDQVVVIRGRDIYKGSMDDIMAVNKTVESFSAARPIVLADQGKILVHAVADNAARDVTFPAEATINFPLGSKIEIVNLKNTVTILLTDDTLHLAGTGLAASGVTLAVSGVATMTKVASAFWVVDGAGLAVI